MSQSLRPRLDAGAAASTIRVGTMGSRRKIGRSVCALLNAGGGLVLCGVEHDGSVVGARRMSKNAAADLEAYLKGAIDPLALFTVRLTELEGREVVSIEVPKGKDAPYVFEGGVWLSADGSVKPADVSALRRLLRDQAEAPVRWERRNSPSMTDMDLDRDEVRATVRDAESKRVRFPDPADDLLVLRQLGARDEHGYTQGGDILFSRNPGQRHPQARAQLVVYEDDKSSDAYTDIRWFEGPLFRACVEILSAVDAINPQRSKFNKGAARRDDRSAYDPYALREGIVNAFVHRDFTSYSGGLKVSIFPSRIEIWNSGRLPEGMSVAAMRSTHVSIPTNPDIAHVFYLRGLMEQVGRGTDLIIRRSKMLGAPAPIWRETPSGVTLTIYSTARTPPGEVRLNARQLKLLGEPGDPVAFTLRHYHSRHAADVTERQARRDLRELELLGYIERRGDGASTEYMRTEKP